MLHKRTPTPEGTTTLPPSPFVAAVAAQQLDADIRAASARCEALKGELAEARVLADSAHRLREMSEGAWDLASEGSHTVQEATRLEQRRLADTDAAARVADLEARIVAVEGDIRQLQANDARVRAQRLAEEVWPPACRALLEPVRALIPAIRAQRAAWDQLEQERAHGFADRDLELAIYGAGFSDDLLSELERWLARAERSGLRAR